MDAVERTPLEQQIVDYIKDYGERGVRLKDALLMFEEGWGKDGPTVRTALHSAIQAGEVILYNNQLTAAGLDGGE